MTSSARSRSLWIFFISVALVGTAAFFIPAYIIRPFTHQSARGLEWAMAIRQRAPLVSLLCAIICFVLAAALWQHVTKWKKALIILPLLIITFSAVMSRLNYFEWMFHPVDRAQFEPESSSKLDAKEMILAVRYGDDARAYPISQMAYHHILNDVVGGVPIAVTY
jgi:flagellar basal body-associated protein FliL